MEAIMACYPLVTLYSAYYLIRGKQKHRKKKGAGFGLRLPDCQ
jgi:hypothetical protein